MRIHATLVALATAAVVVTGCGGDSTSPKPVSHVGRYALISVDGATLPLVLYDQPALKLTVTEGALTLNADNTFIEEVHIDVVANGFPAPPELLSCSGTYHKNGNSFTMTSTATTNCDAGTVTGTLNNNTLTVAGPNETLVFRR
jgi:hypothetical protein